MLHLRQTNEYLCFEIIRAIKHSMYSQELIVFYPHKLRVEQLFLKWLHRLANFQIWRATSTPALFKTQLRVDIIKVISFVGIKTLQRGQIQTLSDIVGPNKRRGTVGSPQGLVFFFGVLSTQTYPGNTFILRIDLESVKHSMTYCSMLNNLNVKFASIRSQQFLLDQQSEL